MSINMFCTKCEKELSEKTIFCPNCGNKINKKTSKSKEVYFNNKKEEVTGRVTREEYMARTDIKTTEEAKKYLGRLRFLFWSIGIGIFLLRWPEAITNDTTAEVATAVAMIAGIVAIIYFPLLIYFVIYCVKVVKKEKETNKMSAIWSIIFAPFSWIWFYPAVTDPLKIIMGKKEPPAVLPTKEQIKEQNVKNAKIFSQTGKMIMFIFAGIIIVAMVVGLITYISS